jgi:hypothetical protein
MPEVGSAVGGTGSPPQVAVRRMVGSHKTTKRSFRTLLKAWSAPIVYLFSFYAVPDLVFRASASSKATRSGVSGNWSNQTPVAS